MENQKKKFEVVKFEDGEFSLDVTVSPDEDTVWLTQKDMVLLYDIDKSRISRHIKKIFSENELNASVVAENATTGLDGKTYKTNFYNLNMITAVGYKVNSKRCIQFQHWANDILKTLKNKNAFTKPLIVFKHGDISLDVTVSPDEDTVWLSQNDMALLFETTKQNISLHIINILNDDELDNSVVKDFFTTASDGKQYQIKMYNLDMIIAVGYRINSKRGTLFRKWATSVLKNYLLNGHVINEERCLTCTSNIISLENKYNKIENEIKNIKNTINVENSKIFYQGEILEAYYFIRKLFFLAKSEIIIVDFYADKFLLDMLTDIKVNITIITSTSSYLNRETIPTNVKVINSDDIHGRYLFIDNIGYIIDNSFNNIGKKRMQMMKLEDSKERILKDII